MNGTDLTDALQALLGDKSSGESVTTGRAPAPASRTA